ncbi:HAD-IA family hydrolase [Hydrogenophaga sp. 5NK40-0174]|uniref:HAD-IA family hydrolase n=1 Tax=Hydrogenophaga sp. 5NK40-0174 TaxID=3127649 RepID=UPI003105CF82
MRYSPAEMNPVATSSAHSLDLARIRGVSIDLDDTLWPIWPTIERAERVLIEWLRAHAPQTARNFADQSAVRAIRVDMHRLRPDLQHDLSAMRRESIRLMLTRSDEDPGLAEAAFDVFFAARQEVEFFDDAMPGLKRLGQRFPMVAVSNGNADVHLIGIGGHFKAALSARSVGVAKPHAGMFMAAAQALDLPLDTVLHVGDDAQLDVAGAARAGMQTAWIHRGEGGWDEAVHGQAPGVHVSSLLQLCDILGC